MDELKLYEIGKKKLEKIFCVRLSMPIDLNIKL
jgi:hypothetical protein